MLFLDLHEIPVSKLKELPTLLVGGPEKCSLLIASSHFTNQVAATIEGIHRFTRGNSMTSMSQISNSSKPLLGHSMKTAPLSLLAVTAQGHFPELIVIVLILVEIPIAFHK